jgi:hypothetical protein
LEIAGGLVGQGRQCVEDAGLVVPIVSDQEVHVHRAAVVASRPNREAADDDVPGAALVQRAAEVPQVLDGGLARL